MSLDQLLEALEGQSSEECFPARLNTLQSQGRDTANIERGMIEVISVLESGERSFVVYGEPQSGKTEFMIALTCKLIDLGYETIFVVMNDNTELETQNFRRFHRAAELNPTPLRDSQVLDMTNERLRASKQRIIFCRKNSSRLRALIQQTRFMQKRVVIDDEADFATPNARINRTDANNVTAINQLVGELGDLGPDGEGTYIGVTATPARLDLNNTYLNNSRKWVFLDSHENYKGHSFFFPTSREEAARSNYQLVRLPDDGDDPRLLRHAIFRFLIRVAAKNINSASEPTAYSMLVHTAGRTNDHEQDQRDINNVLAILSDHQSTKFRQYANEILNIAEDLVGLHNLSSTSIKLAEFVLRNIGKNEVLVINHRNDRDNVARASDPNAMFTFAIGGNIVSRGLTFENLLTFFFSRNVRGRLQQNTYIQRARMFGNRPYSEFFELCVPTQLFEDWATCFHDHELSLRLARAGVYQHIQSGRTNVVDRAAIDNANVTMERSERVVGEIFDLTEELEDRLVSFDNQRPLDFIQELIEANLISKEHFPSALMGYLREVSLDNQSDVWMVRRSDSGQNLLQNIERYQGDGDPVTITRARGGIIHAMLNRRTEYDSHSHFILPIKNQDGKARFLYKPRIGQTVIQNLRVS